MLLRHCKCATQLRAVTRHHTKDHLWLFACPNCCRQQLDFGGVVSFVVRGGRNAAWRVIDATRMLSITANLGDVKTTITHPATTTHGRISDEHKARAGISEGLIRVAVGLENIEDIFTDLARGLDG